MRESNERMWRPSAAKELSLRDAEQILSESETNRDRPEDRWSPEQRQVARKLVGLQERTVDLRGDLLYGRFAPKRAANAVTDAWHADLQARVMPVLDEWRALVLDAAGLDPDEYVVYASRYLRGEAK